MKHVAVWMAAVMITSIVDATLRGWDIKSVWGKRIIVGLAFAITFNVGSWVGGI